MLPELKASVKSMEAWIVVVLVVGLLYLTSKGVVDLESLGDKGEGLLANAETLITTSGAVITAVAFAAKRTYLKYQKMRADVEVAITKPAAELSVEE